MIKAKILRWMSSIEYDQRDFEDYNYQTQENDEASDDFGLQRLVQVLVDRMGFTADELESAAHSIQTQPVVKPNRKCCVNGKVESGALKNFFLGSESVLLHSTLES